MSQPKLTFDASGVIHEPQADEWIAFFKRLEERIALREFFKYSFKVQASGKTAVLDDIFRLADPADIGLTLASGMLRGTWRISKHVPHWRMFREKTKDALIAVGEDPTQVLRGLLDDKKEYVDQFGLGDVLFKTHPSLK